MLELKTIVVPVDFSKRSLAAAEHGVALAKRFRSQLVFVHVVPVSPYDYAAYESGFYTGAAWPSDEQIQQRLAKELDALVSGVSPPVSIEKVILKGDPPTKIENLARERDASLIIIPTHGYGPFRRFVLGSVAAKVLHDTSCPIMTGAHVPEIPFNSAHPYRRVACAVDLREHSETVLRWASDFATAYDAELSLIHAAPLLDAEPAEGQFFTDHLRNLLLSAKKEEMQELVNKVGCKASLLVESDEVDRYVPSAAEEAGADVLVIGRSPLQGILGRLRTHAYALVRESPCPVVSV
jgi:nucleotide-binding universal stress UspA family protein